MASKLLNSRGRPGNTVEKNARILLVDDDATLRFTMSRLLGILGYDVSEVSNGRDALALIDAETFDVIVSDICMPGTDGLSLLRSIRSKDSDVPVVFLTGSPSITSASEAVEHGAFRYLTKPVTIEQLKDVVRRAIIVRRMALARREAREAGIGGGGGGDLAGVEVGFASALDKMWMAMQPIFSWRARDVFAYEALLRTDEPSLCSPVAFLDAAERLGRGLELSRRIRRRVADQMIEMPPAVPVFVNVRPADLVDDELCAPDGALTPFSHGVVLEVTERSALEHVNGLLPAVQRLRRMGFRIALDDLGAGYAGLASFALLEPEIVKVDMSLIRGIHLSSTKQKLFRSFCSLCKEINTEIIAEGVELAEERDCLNELGGDLYQGFLFARPGRDFVRPGLTELGGLGAP
jgi:EAL domain-containing protein (putative c-di-GMP-specific phosphodiesterase class I)